jgi:hypothetical protein
VARCLERYRIAEGLNAGICYPAAALDQHHIAPRTDQLKRKRQARRACAYDADFTLDPLERAEGVPLDQHY